MPTESLSDKDVYPAKNLILDSLSSKNLGCLFISACISVLISLLEFNHTLTYLLCLSVALLLPLHFSRKLAYLMHFYQQTGKRRAAHQNRQKELSITMLTPTTSIQLTLAAIVLLLLPVYVFYFIHWFPGLLLILLGGACFPYLIIFSLHSNDNKPYINLFKLLKEIKPYALKLSLTSLGFYWFTLFASDLSATVSPLIIAIGVSTLFATLCTIIVISLSTKIFVMTERKFAARHVGTTSNAKGPTSIYNQENISNLDTDIDQALKTGQYTKVISLLEDALKRNANSNLRRQQLFLLLSELKDLEKLSRYAELFLHWMLERNKIKDASQFIYQLRKHNPAFLLHDLRLISMLAKQFFHRKKHALVLWLAEDAKIRFRPCEELASLYLSATQTLITHFKDFEKVEEYLLFILQSCSEYPSAEAAKALLIHLQNNQKKQDDLRT